MEALSRLLHSRYQAGWISYHPKTAELQISHLMFADDVMIFFDGSCNSLHEISECLDDFASWSGLEMNKEKTELFTAGLDQQESFAISRLGFSSGSLPIRYLGLPLMSRKLKISEYTPLIRRSRPDSRCGPPKLSLLRAGTSSSPLLLLELLTSEFLASCCLRAVLSKLNRFVLDFFGLEILN